MTGFNETVAWLKQTHGLGHFQARLVAEAFGGGRGHYGRWRRNDRLLLIVGIRR